MIKVNMDIADRYYQLLKELPEVKRVEILPNCDSEVDLRLQIVVLPSLTWERLKKIPNTISKVSWEIFEETGELPAVEWDVIEER